MEGQVTRGYDWGDSLRVCGRRRTCRSYVELGGDDCGVAQLGCVSEFWEEREEIKKSKERGNGSVFDKGQDVCRLVRSR